MVLHSQGSLPGRHARSKFQLWMGGGEGEQQRQCNISWWSNKSWTSLRKYFRCRRHKGNVHFDGVWYTQRRKMQICGWFGLNATKFSEYFIGGHRYAIWRKNASISFKLLFHRWDGGDGCWSPLMLWAWLVHELSDKSCWNACTFVLFVSDQCDLDNLGIQMGQVKSVHSCIRMHAEATCVSMF